MKNIYLDEVYSECLLRIEKISPDTKPLWGKMCAAQMLNHCAEVQDVLNGKPLKNTPFFIKLIKNYIKKMVTNDTPYPRNSRTHPQYIQSAQQEFEPAKKRLLKGLADFKKRTREENEALEHTLFGKLTLEEKSSAIYKHLDHHLQQFGV